MRRRKFGDATDFTQLAKSVPLLTVDEEDRLGHLAYGGDLAARHELVTRNLRLVIWRVERLAWRARGHVADMISEGNLGLFRATKTWEPGNNRFASYAVFWIDHQIHKYLAEKHSFIRIPNYVEDIRSKVRRGVPLDATEADQWSRRKSDVGARTVSVECGDENSGLIAMTSVADRPRDDPSYQIETDDEVAKVLSWLSPRDRMVVWNHAALGESHGEIGAKLGVSAERVRQIYCRSLKRIRTNQERMAS